MTIWLLAGNKAVQLPEWFIGAMLTLIIMLVIKVIKSGSWRNWFGM